MKPYNRVNLPFTGIASFCKFPIHTDLETLSAAIGKKGVNIKLASKLTQWDIQISNRKFEHLEEGQKKQ